MVSFCRWEILLQLLIQLLTARYETAVTNTIITHSHPAKSQSNSLDLISSTTKYNNRITEKSWGTGLPKWALLSTRLALSCRLLAGRISSFLFYFCGRFSMKKRALAFLLTASTWLLVLRNSACTSSKFVHFF